MTTAEDKIKAISEKAFPKFLRDLEIYLGITGWLRYTIERYIQLSELLQDRKTNLIKGLARGYKGIKRKIQATKLRYTLTEEEKEAF